MCKMRYKVIFKVDLNSEFCISVTVVLFIHSLGKKQVKCALFPRALT